MLSIFQSNYEFKKKWTYATYLSTEEQIMQDPQVRFHGQKMTDIFAEVINTIDHNMIFCVPMLQQLGRSHFHLGARKKHYIVTFLLN
jgi:hypothetical protein